MHSSIGIVTMVGNFNYGNRLQNYAVSKIYEAMGCEVETLNYPGRSFPSALRNTAAGILLPRETTHPEERMSSERKKSFKRFSDLIPTRRVDEPLSKLKGKYDFFSVGSDQVWNPNYVDSYKWMFLEFADRKQRITLAPSIGVSSLSSPYARHMIARGLRGFDYLSVRELDGAKLIKQMTGQVAQVVIDPTLMLRSDTWLKVADDRMVPDHSYVFTYLLGEKSAEQDDYIKGLLHEQSAIQVSLSDKARDGELDAGPSEFIALIHRASHVVTDSYHAAVFSLLLGTPVTIFRRVGRSNLFSRLATLTKTFGIEGAIFGSNEFGKAQVESEAINHVLTQERKKLSTHLKRSADALRVELIEDGI